MQRRVSSWGTLWVEKDDRVLEEAVELAVADDNEGLSWVDGAEALAAGQGFIEKGIEDGDGVHKSGWIGLIRIERLP